MNTVVKSEPWPVNAQPMQSNAPAIYRAIAKVMGEVGKAGVSKDQKNTQQGYNFRGIDAVYNALSPFLAAAGLVILPRVMSREVTERQTKSGGVLFYVVLDVEFDFVAAEDGSKHTVRVPGEAMDSGDKATNKAMSAAYKYACMEAFCIPTEGTPDADQETHEVAPKEIPNPRGDLGRDVPPDVAISKADAIREILNEKDVSEDMRIAKVFDLHHELAKDADIYVAASDLLKAPERKAWKEYVKIAKQRDANERASSPR